MGGLSDLKQELQTGVDDLHGLRRDLTAAEKWSATFQKKHGLDRPAKIGTPRSSFFKWGLIVVLVLVELFTNGELLSKGSELGLVGGIVEALIFAVLNVGVALMFGVFAIPYLNHRNLLLKLFGFLSLLAYRLQLGAGCAVGVILLPVRRRTCRHLASVRCAVVIIRRQSEPLTFETKSSTRLVGVR